MFTPNDIRIANLALASFGALPIQSFDQSVPPGPAVALRYREVIDGLLCETPWSFTRQTVQLVAVAEASPDSDPFLASGFQFAFALPPNLLGLPSGYLATPRRHGTPYKDVEVQNQTVYANRSPLWAVANLRVDPTYWPPYFTTAAVACLAAELIMPVSGNSGLLEAKQQEAKLADSRNQGSKVLSGNPLIDCRH